MVWVEELGAGGGGAPSATGFVPTAGSDVEGAAILASGSASTAVSTFVFIGGGAAFFAAGSVVFDSDGGSEIAFGISSFTEVGLAATANSVSGGFGSMTSESTGFEGGRDSGDVTAAVVDGLIAGS